MLQVPYKESLPTYAIQRFRHHYQQIYTNENVSKG